MRALTLFSLLVLCCWGVVGEEGKASPENFISELSENKFALVAFDENTSEEREVFYEYLNAIFSLDLALIDPNDDGYLDIIVSNEIDPSTPQLCVFLYGMRLGAPIKLDFEKDSQHTMVEFIRKRVERRIELAAPVALLETSEDIQSKVFEDYPKKKPLVVFCTDAFSDQTINDLSLIAQTHHLKSAKATSAICQYLWGARTHEFTDPYQNSPSYVSPFGLRKVPERGFMVVLRGVTLEHDASPTLEFGEGLVGEEEREIVRSLGRWIQRWSFPGAMPFTRDNIKRVEAAQRTHVIIYGDAGVKSTESDFILNNIRLSQQENVLPHDWIYGYAQGAGVPHLHHFGLGEFTVVLRHNGFTYKSKIGNYDAEKLRIISKEILNFPPMERSNVVPKKVKTGKVNTVVGLNFIDVVMKSEKVVLLVAHDPEDPKWEETEKQLQTIGKSLRKTLKVCKIDATSNTLPSPIFSVSPPHSPPTIFMYHPTTQEVSKMPPGYDLAKWSENHRFLSREVKVFAPPINHVPQMHPNIKKEL